MVKLRVSVGGSYTDLAVINCNDELHPLEFDTPEFKGRAVIRIKDFVGITNDGSEPIHSNDYFKGHNRKFSIQVEGRFKREWDGEQVYFGTDFDRAVELPHGFETMLRVARYIDPVVKTSLTKDGQPWILSPLVSSINTLAAWRPQDANLPSPPLTPRQSADMAHALNMSESSSMWGFLGKLKRGNRSSVASASSHTSHDVYGSQPASTNNSSDQLDNNHRIHESPSSSLHSSSTSSDWPNGSDNGSHPTIMTAQEAHDDTGMPLGKWRPHVEEDTTFFMKKAMTTAQRRKHFQTEEARKQFVFKTDLVHGFEFFSPHMDFNTFDIHMGLSMNIRKYLADQPVRYTCRTLAGDVVFWAVQFELVD
ncbi:hypothetical protein BGZ96_012528 [Linnemannia gamsii]|uniref:Domain of unknown function at the cortex 1 domain-containing protein n=1 Tax=Linnemannia gamsii TaxID=64522 RepID=A0ABQ7JQ79_9FUNG|nr:hypothetical protein BGZ96_012528 [Linnemannia gamsii]